MSLQFPLHAFFIALPLEGAAKEEFVRFQALLQEYDEILRFQNPQSPHLTLQYWAEVMQIEYVRIVEEAKKVAAKSQSFDLPIIGAQTFGQRGEDRVLFLNVAFSPELATLKKLCPWPNVKPFAPHITLARIRHPQKFAVHKKEIMKNLKHVEFSMEVDRLRSYAEVGGARQTVIEDFVFGG